MCALQTSWKGCTLLLEEAHYHTVLISQHCGFTFTNFVYCRILTLMTMRSVSTCFNRLPEDGTAGLNYVVNTYCVALCFMICVCGFFY